MFRLHEMDVYGYNHPHFHTHMSPHKNLKIHSFSCTLQIIYIGKCLHVEKLLDLKMDCCENLFILKKLFDLKNFLD